MSLFGVMSRRPVHFRTTVPNGNGWGFVVRQAATKWTKSVGHGDGGAVAMHLESHDWTMIRADGPGTFEGREATGDVLVATTPAPGDGRESLCMLQASSWHFAYEGTIGDGDALRRALDPTRILPDAVPRAPGELIFAYIMSHLVRGGAVASADVAMARVASEIHRARRLGSAAFICADGTNLYACSFGQQLLFKNVSDAILVGSPDVISEGPATHALQDGALVVLAKRPHLGWAILAHP